MAESKNRLQDSLKEFADESFELLEKMEEGLLHIRENGFSAEQINAIFRAVHTTKGSAGIFELTHLSEFTHVAESLLDRIRKQQIALDDEILELLLQVKDHMQKLVVFYAERIGQTPTDELVDMSSSLMSSLNSFMSPQAKEKEVVASNVQTDAKQLYHLSVKFKKELYEKGMDPANFIRYLSELSGISNFVLDSELIGGLDEFVAKECNISCSFDINEPMSEAEITEVFDFIKDDVEIKLTPLNSPEPKQEATEVAKPEIAAPTAPVPVADAPTILSSSTLRVDSYKVDTLINLIGEMVIANATVVQRANILSDDELLERMSVVSRMIEEIRESAMKIRMVQVGETFNKFKRIVHDLSSKLNKDIELVISGGDTEIDKTVVEKISDPLVHIVRNAIDHGIESTDERIQKGKSAKGQIRLNAYHEAGTIAIEISDDGKGLDEAKIFAKAVEKGVVQPNVKLPQKEIFALILEPGFSTAEVVTNLSGRGVGMDVVKRNVESLRGTIDIKTAKGKGSVFTLHLPLTLAIIDGFLVKVGNTFFVIQLDMIIECIEAPLQRGEHKHGSNFINLRGSILPLLNLREHFKERAPKSNASDSIVVVQYAGTRFGLIVEELHGEFQTVIKPLGKIFRNIKGLGGSTILGSGEVALILDIPILINHAIALQEKTKEEG